MADLKKQTMPLDNFDWDAFENGVVNAEVSKEDQEKEV